MRKWKRLSLRIIVVLLTIGIAMLRYISWKAKQTDDAGIPRDVVVNTCVLDENYRDEIASAREQVLSIFTERATPSIAIGVSVKGRTIWSEAIGYSDIEERTAATCSTMYRINSVSKLLTAAVAARLFEKGEFSWDLDVRRYVPEFPDKGYIVTPRLLASHRSGIRGYRDDNEAVQTRHFPTIASSLELFKGDPLAFEPGTDFLYSGFGYVLLSAALERASGRSFEDLVQHEVFDVLRMTHSGIATKAYPLEPAYYDYVTPYSSDGSMVVSPPNDFSFKVASGGFLSSVGDLVKLGNAHIPSLNSDFLSDATIAMLFQPEGSPLPGFGYALGWMTAVDPDLREVHFQFGAGSGGTSVLAVYPRQEVCLAILSNLGHAKFPMNRLLRIADSFQYSWTAIIFNIWVSVLAALILHGVYKTFKQNRSFL